MPNQIPQSKVSIVSTALVNEAGQMYAIATMERPLAEQGHG